MTIDTSQKALQIATRNKIGPFLGEDTDDLSAWFALYFEIEVTTSPNTQKAQERDLGRFLAFIEREYGTIARAAWTPRVSRDFVVSMEKTLDEDGARRWSDRSINRAIAHLKTWAKWINKNRPFLAGNPMDKIKTLAVGNQLEIERAVTKQERNRLLDAADQLLLVGGRSRDRSRYADARPRRKSYRPYRNRAIVYTLLETGMRRAAITRLNLADVDFKRRILPVVEKGGSVHAYPISRQGMQAIREYLEFERPRDFEKWQSPALFLSPASNPHGDGRLNPRVVNTLWNDTCRFADVEERTPHSARHGMGTHIIEKTGNVAAVQRQLGHKNAAFSMQYSRISRRDLQDVLDNR